MGFVVASCAPSRLSGAGGEAQAPTPVSAAALPASIDYPVLAGLLADRASGVLLLDVRTEAEYAQGRIPGAALLPHDALEASFREADPARPIVVYCRSGNRSAIAKRTLEALGYRNVADFGGLGNWKGPLER